MSSDRFTLRVDPELQEQIQECARSSGRSESDVVREAVRQFVARRQRGESCFDRLARLKVIGAAGDLPPDLSTNPRYMEGFGERPKSAGRRRSARGHGVTARRPSRARRRRA